MTQELPQVEPPVARYRGWKVSTVKSSCLCDGERPLWVCYLNMCYLNMCYLNMCYLNICTQIKSCDIKTFIDIQPDVLCLLEYDSK